MVGVDQVLGVKTAPFGTRLLVPSTRDSLSQLRLQMNTGIYHSILINTSHKYRTTLKQTSPTQIIKILQISINLHR